MENLNDYSGEFRPNLDLRDFSKDFIVKLILEWARAYMVNQPMMLMAYLKEKLSPEDQAGFGDIMLRMLKDLSPSLAKLAKIEVKTLMDAQKVGQLYLDGAVFMGSEFAKADIDFKNPNHMIMTIRKCPYLAQMEAANMPAEQYQKMCVEGETKAMEAYLGLLLPGGIKATPLQVPPRKNKDGIACQWEMKYEH